MFRNMFGGRLKNATKNDERQHLDQRRDTSPFGTANFSLYKGRWKNFKVTISHGTDGNKNVQYYNQKEAVFRAAGTIKYIPSKSHVEIGIINPEIGHVRNVVDILLGEVHELYPISKVVVRTHDTRVRSELKRKGFILKDSLMVKK